MLQINNFSTTIYNYELELKKIDPNVCTPNRAANIENLNAGEIERYINNLRKLVIEIGETLDIDKLISDVITQLQSKKLTFDLEASQEYGTTENVELFGKSYQRTRSSDGTTYQIQGFNSTNSLLVQARYRLRNQVVDVDIQFANDSVLVSTIDPIFSNGVEDQSLRIIIL